MLNAEVIVALIVAAGIVFLVVRPPFLRVMVSARLADIRLVGWEIEMLAEAGQVDRCSAFYRRFTGLCRALGSLDGNTFPGVLVWVGLLIAKHNHPHDEGQVLEWSEALEESRTVYRRHSHLVRRLVANVLDALRYRSLLVWLLVKALDSVRDGSEMVLFLADFARIRPERLVGAVLHRRELPQP